MEPLISGLLGVLQVLGHSFPYFFGGWVGLRDLIMALWGLQLSILGLPPWGL